MSKAVFQIDILDCAGCAKKMEQQVSELKGIESVKVLGKLGKIRTPFDNSQIEADQIKQAILQQGFSVYTIKIAT